MIRAGMLIGGLLGAIAGIWLAFPSLASLACEIWLHRQGFQDVSVHVDYPGWRRLVISTVRFSREVNGERFTAELKGNELEYSLTGLFSAQLDRVTVPDMSLSLAKLPHPARKKTSAQPDALSDDDSSPPLSMVRVHDLVQGLPVLPVGELRVGQATIIREQAAGPLREVHVTGTVKQQPEGLLAELVLQGTGTQRYVLRMSDLATRVTTVQLETRDSPPKPIITWRSETLSGDGHVQLRGVFDVNVQEVAPFLALLLPLGTDWQQATGRLQANWQGTASATAALASVWHDPRTQVQGSVQMSLKLPALAGMATALTVALPVKFAGNATEARWSVEPATMVTAGIEAGKIAALRPLKPFLPAGTQSFRIESTGEVRGVVRWADSPVRFTAEGPVIVSYDAAQGPAHVEMLLTRLAGHAGGIERAEGKFEVVGSLANTISGHASFREIKANVEGSVVLDGQRINGTIHPSSSLTVLRLRQGVATLPRATLRLSDAMPVRFDLATGRWGAGSSTALLNVPKILMAKHRITFRRATLRLEEINGASGAWSGRGTAAIQGLTAARQAARSMPVDLAVRLAADGGALKADLQAHSEDTSLTVNTQAEHSWATGRGGLQGRLDPLSFGPSGFQVRRLWNPWPFSLDVTAGTAAATVVAEWDSAGPHGWTVKSAAGEVMLKNVTGGYRDLAFRGLTTNVHLTAKEPDRIMTSRPAEISIASVNQGIEASRISLTAQVEWDMRQSLPVVEMRDVRCELLGGILTSQGVRADLAHPPYSFTILARALDLEKILSLEQQKGLQGTGLLDGTIPVTIRSRGITVKDAAFETRPPGGVISYHPSVETAKAVTGANEQMRLVLRALNNFHYNVLQVGAQYAEEGTLNLEARLEGRNPDLKKTPPVHFNLTVQENLPALLKSLRLVQDIQTSVENRFTRP